MKLPEKSPSASGLSNISSKPTAFTYQKGYEGYENEVAYLLDGLLPAKSFGVLYGPSGSYKSFLTISWALHVATGKDWGSHKVTKNSVLYIVAEGGQGAPRRVKVWCDNFNNGEEPVGFYRIDTPVYVASNQQIQMLIQTIDNIKEDTGDTIGLIIIDTLARCFAGADENSTQDMNEFVAGCDTIKARTSATILVVHHSGKNEEKGGRGSSALRAACDFEYRASKAKDDDHAVILSCEKMKDDQPITRTSFNLMEKYVYTNEHGRDIHSLCLIDNAHVVKTNFVEKFKQAGGNASELQAFIWYSVSEKQKQGELVTKVSIREEFKARYGVKHFSRELSKLLDLRMIEITEGDHLKILKV